MAVLCALHRIPPRAPLARARARATGRGVGKTETALALADILCGGEKKLITINMSDYQEAHSVSGLKGSRLRIACFVGNAVQQTAWFRMLRESNGVQPDLHLGWYGRGFLQLTNPNGALANGNNNYYRYFRSLGRSPHVPGGQQEYAWRDSIGTDPHHAAQSAAAYWTWPDKSTPTAANPNRPQVDNANRYADTPSTNQRRTIATAAGSKVWYYNQSFTDCAAAVNYPATVGQSPPNMNGLVDRSTAFVNALLILDDRPTFATASGATETTPENFRRRTVP